MVLAIALGMVTPVSQKQLVLTSCVGESEAKAERSLWGGDLQGTAQSNPSTPLRSAQDDTVPGERPKQAFLHHKKATLFRITFTLTEDTFFQLITTQFHRKGLPCYLPWWWCNPHPPEALRR